MIRNSLFAFAATLATLSVVASTLAAMYAGTGAGIA
jgi:citrate synthase